MKATHASPIRAQLSSCFLMLALAFLSTPAHADTTDWAMSEGGRMRVVTLPSDDDGRIQAVLQIDLKPGWITYWREPGEAGIPPQISIGAASGVTLLSMEYPVPKLIENGDLRDIGYDKPVSIPFVLRALGAAKTRGIKLTAFIGVCQNICIPFQADFELGSDKGNVADAEETEIVQAGRTGLPEAASDDFKVLNFHITPDKTLLGVQLQLPEDAPKEPEIFVAGPSGYAYSEPQNMVRDKRKLSFYMNIKGLPKDYKAAGKSWGILVKSGERAMETQMDFPAQ